MGGGGGCRVRVKVCGLTRADDARAAADAGVDAVGLIFYPPSPRGVDLRQAEAVAGAVPPFVTKVGVFVDAGEDEVAGIIARIPLDLLQFHGAESPERCQRAPRPWVKTLAMKAGVDLDDAARRYPGAQGLLLDTFSASEKGGTGRRFDWGLARRTSAIPIILAGGLNAGNVAEAIATVRPFAVDVNGGVEASPGVKDARQIAAFVKEVERVQASQHRA